MVTDSDYSTVITRCLPFLPTQGQKEAIARVSSFLASPDSSAVMILRGAAGTGKTSLASAIVRALLSMHQKMVLLAPTGRAAKVFSLYSGRPAYTIHRRIYRQKTQTSFEGQFNLNDNLHSNTLFLVDEASMIAEYSQGEQMFSQGRLLDDLIHYIYNGNNCRLMLIGDTAQLPPIGAAEAPALISGRIAGYGLTVFDYDLNEVLRQSQQSGILSNATMLRSLITHDSVTQLPQIRLRGFCDVSVVNGADLVEQIASSYSRVGVDETIVITRSNKRAGIFNRGIRAQVLDHEDELSSGDQLIIVKNNYHWTDPQKEPGFLANGDRCEVRRIRNIRELYGFRFADVTLIFPDYDNFELTATVNLSTLSSEAPSLDRDSQERLFNQVYEDYFDVTLKRDRIERVMEDPYYNAIQVKHAYAVTCHKAQGGQWAHVYLDQGYMTDEMLTPDYIHWLYTAFTRATEHLYLVNWPEKQIFEG